MLYQSDYTQVSKVFAVKSLIGGLLSVLNWHVLKQGYLRRVEPGEE